MYYVTGTAKFQKDAEETPSRRDSINACAWSFLVSQNFCLRDSYISCVKPVVWYNSSSLLHSPVLCFLLFHSLQDSFCFIASTWFYYSLKNPFLPAFQPSQ
jgi:hypothetical protein